LEHATERLTEKGVKFGREWVGAWKEFAKGAMEARNEAAAMLHEIGRQDRQFGMSEVSKRLDDLDSTKGATASEVARARSELKELNDKKVREEFADPVDRIVEKFKSAKSDLDRGLLSKEGFDLVKDKTKRELLQHEAELAAKTEEPPYRLAQQESRRFNFGRLSNPAADARNKTNENMLKVLQDLRDIAKADANKTQNAITLVEMTGI
jgi:hypothetical protein